MSSDRHAPDRHRVVIAGGGVAGLEALIALRSLAAEHVATTLLAPQNDFWVRALSVEDAFSRPTPPHYALADICADHDAAFVCGALERVDVDRGVAVTADGEELPYDSLLVAAGARSEAAFPHATTFRGLQDAEAMHGIIQDVEAGITTQVAFVVPDGVTWTLPLYELALMTAERASSLGLDVLLTVVTPEDRPLGLFGLRATETVEEVLSAADIAVVPSAHVSDVVDDMVLASPGNLAIPAGRVVALPRMVGLGIPGLPSDGAGFLPVDEYARVTGADSAFAAGDGTTFPIKQGAIAAQQALTAAMGIAERAGANVVPRPFRPVLRAKLLAGARELYLREAVAGGAGASASEATDRALWWPPSKLAAPHLAPYLDRLQRTGTPSGAPHERHSS